jgi:hypothetical protein
MLAVPICAMLWAERSKAGKIVFMVTAIAAAVSSNVLLEFLGKITYHLRTSSTGFSGELLNATLGRPVPVVLLAQGAVLCLFLARRTRPSYARVHPLFSEPLENSLGQESLHQASAHSLQSAGD